jgi:hypothetical protein
MSKIARTNSVDGGPAIRNAAAGVAFLSLAVALLASPALAASDKDTAAIESGSEATRAMKMEEPSYQTREERLKAKPLDWNKTIGKPKPRVLSPAEKRALLKAKPQMSEGGAPNPKADEEARKLHPDEWK